MKYTAEDGTLFSTEKECLDYEKKLKEEKMKEIIGDFIAYNEDIEYSSFADSYFIPKYIYILSNFEKVVNYIDKYTNYYADGINSNDIYMYDKDEYEWITITDLIAKHEEAIKSLVDVKNKILRDNYN